MLGEEKLTLAIPHSAHRNVTARAETKHLVARGKMHCSAFTLDQTSTQVLVLTDNGTASFLILGNSRVFERSGTGQHIM